MFAKKETDLRQEEGLVMNRRDVYKCFCFQLMNRAATKYFIRRFVKQMKFNSFINCLKDVN